MDRPLWAPWRMEFIDAPKSTSCIFCEFPKQTGEESDRKNLIVHRGTHTFTILNRFPYNSGHLMVIPRVHAGSFEELTAEIFSDLNLELKRAVAQLKAVYQPEGFNIGMNLGKVAGAGIPHHLHFHIVPRWGGDTNFMAVLADTKVIVEHLDSAWERLSHAFAEDVRSLTRLAPSGSEV